MKKPNSDGTTARAGELPLDEALRRARTSAAQLGRRERVLSLVGLSGLVIVSARGIVDIAFDDDGSRPLALGLAVAVACCLGVMALAFRTRSTFEHSAAHVRFLELVRDAADHIESPAADQHPYRAEERPKEIVVLGAEAARAVALAGPRRDEGASWGRRGVAAFACLAAIVTLGWVVGPGAAAKRRWTFLEPTSAPADLGLLAHMRGSGDWQVEDDEQATGARALVNRVGDPAGAPALLIATSMWTRDLRAVTRCKASPNLAARACGVVFRFHDDANYASARLDAAQGALVVTVTERGKERELGRRDAVAAPGVWQELALDVRAGRVRLSWNGQPALDVLDALPASARRGRVVGAGRGHRDLRRAQRGPAPGACPGLRAAPLARPSPKLTRETDSFAMLTISAIFLAAAVLSVAVFRRLGLGSVLGYLAAGTLIGPSGLGLIQAVDETLQIAELGIVLLLFLIGLELQPSRLWKMRNAVFGLGTAQVAVTTVIIALVAKLLGAQWPAAVAIGLGLAMSSTAIATQNPGREERARTCHGRAAFGILLFQDLVAIPALALIPLLGTPESHSSRST